MGQIVTLQLSKDFLKIPLAAQEESWPISGSGINRLIKGTLKNSFPVLKYISHWAVTRRKFLSGPWLIFLWFGISLGVLGGYLPGYCVQGLHSWVKTPAQVPHFLWWAAVSPSGGEEGEAREALRGHFAKRDASGVHILFPSNCNLEAKSKNTGFEVLRMMTWSRTRKSYGREEWLLRWSRSWVDRRGRKSVFRKGQILQDWW